MPGSFALLFNIDLSGGHAHNFLVQNVTRALIDRLVLKYAGEILRDTVGYDIFKIWEDLFLSQEERDNMILEGIQSEDLCKIRSGAGEKKTCGVDAENKLNKVYGTKYRIRLDHQVLTDHGVFYPQALYNDLVFELTLAHASQVVKGSDPTKLKYKLKNIELGYEMIRSKILADEAHSVYSTGKEFLYDHPQRPEMVSFPTVLGSRFNIKVNSQKRSLKGILLLFVEPYTPGARDSEKYFNPDLTKVSVAVNGSPNMLYKSGIEGKDIWAEASRFFVTTKNKTQHMNLTKFYTDDKFGLLINLRAMADQALHGGGARRVNTKDGVQLELERKSSGSSAVNCLISTIPLPLLAPATQASRHLERSKLKYA